MLPVIAALLVTATPSPPPDTLVAKALALYDEVCLQAFPDDSAVDALMAAKGARPLTANQVRITLLEDPGRGWLLPLEGRTISVFLELPPFHACSVRMPRPEGRVDYFPYEQLIASYRKSHRGFVRQPVHNLDRGELHIHALQDVKPLSPNSEESLLAIDQQAIDPQRAITSKAGVELRFVHQIYNGR